MSFWIGGLVIASLVFGTVLISSWNDEDGNEDVSSILNDLNQEIEPCDNFYEFACGGYSNSTLIPDGANGIDRLSELRAKIEIQLRSSLEEPISPNEPRLFKLVKILYRTCMDTRDIEEVDLEPLREILEQYGKWPVVEGDTWQEGGFDWARSVYTSRNLGFPVNNFITLRVTMDMANSTRYMIELNKPSFGISRVSLIKGIENDDVKIYFKRMIDAAKLLGANEERATRELAESLNFEIKLAEEQDYNQTRTTIGQLGEDFPFVNWKEYINNLLPPDARVDANEVVLVSSRSSIRGLEKLLNSTAKRVQANYALWRVVAVSLKFLTRNKREREMERVSATWKYIATSSDDRWKDCVGNISTSSLSIITNALYVRKYFDEGAREKVLEIVADVKREMIEILKKAEWINDKSRTLAVENTESILSLVAYPVELLDDKEIEKLYADLKSSPNDLLGNVLQSEKILLDHSLGLLRKQVNKSEWVTHDYSTEVNAYYNPTENNILLPASILQGVFFGGDRPRYMNYGAIGSIIGHEISHSFDPMGMTFDEDGNSVTSWTPEMQKTYNEMAWCIINQYSNYTVDSVGLNVNGNKTLEENMADNSGMKTAYMAYKKYVKKNGPESKLPGLKYTPEQMFWISAARTHCNVFKPQEEERIIRSAAHSPGRFRVIGSFANSVEFAVDFNCPAGSYMNPVHKCDVL